MVHRARRGRIAVIAVLLGAACVVLALAVLGACAPAAKPPISLPADPSPALAAPIALTLSPVAFVHLPGWREDTHGQVLAALKLSCAHLASLADVCARPARL